VSGAGNGKETAAMVRFLRLTVIMAALAAGTVSSALAQSQEYRGTAAQQAACRPNVYRFCAGEIPNVRKITACLRRNIARLTPDCAAIFAEEQPQPQR
jgi:hypothetical protein